MDPNDVTVTSWNGEPNYECNYCQFKTLDELTMAEHIMRHRWMGDIGVQTPPPPGAEETYKAIIAMPAKKRKAGGE